MSDRLEPAAGGYHDLPQLLLANADRIRRFASARIPSRHASVFSPEDLRQDVFVAAFTHFEDFQPRNGESRAGAFSRWIITIAENELIDAIRAADCQKRGGGVRAYGFETVLDLMNPAEPTPSRITAGREAEQAVRGAIAALPDGQQRVIFLFHLEGRTVEEIAKALGMSFNQVKHQLYVGRQALRNLLGHAGNYFTDAGATELTPVLMDPADELL